MDQEKIGKLIKVIRKKNNLTQAEFAEKYGVTYQAVSKWENGMLDFEPKCQKETLKNQVIFMQGYLSILKLRAEIEGIEL